MIQEIPRYLALTGESEALYDQRVYKVLRSNVPAGDRIAELMKDTRGNKAIDYSNKYGVLVHCMQKDIGLKNLDSLNQEFTEGVQKYNPLELNLKETPIMLEFSPSEDLLAVVTNTQFLIIKTSQLKSKKISHEINLIQPATDFKWVLDEGVLYWKYESTAYHYSLTTSISTPFLDTKCTSASFINNHYVLGQCFTVKIFNLGYNLEHTATYPNEAYTSTEFYGINLAEIISITKINNLDSTEFREDDVYIFVEIFYQTDLEDDSIISNKYIFFAKGDLRTNKVEFKGGQLLYNNKNDRGQYIHTVGDAEEKRGFSSRSYVNQKLGVYVLSIERSDNIYLVNIKNPFQELKLVDFVGKYEFRFDGFVCGFALLKNLLPSERTYEGSSKDLQMITSMFQGRYLNIGIKGKDMDILIPFPVSILAWNDKGSESKQYLAVTDPYIDREDEMDVKLKRMKELQGSSCIVDAVDLFRPGESQFSRDKSQEARQPEGFTKVVEQIQSLLDSGSEDKKQGENKEEKSASNLGFSSTNKEKPDTLFSLNGAFAKVLPNNPGSSQNGSPLFKPSTAGLGLFGNATARIFSSNSIFPVSKAAEDKADNKLNLEVKDLPPSSFLNFPKPLNPLDIQNKILDKPSKQQIKSPIPNLPPNAENLTITTGSKETPNSQGMFSNFSKQKLEPKIQMKKGMKQEVQPPKEEQIKQDKIKKYLDQIQDESRQFEGFLKYVDDARAKSSLLDKAGSPASLSQEMVGFLQRLRKQEQLIEMSIFQLEVFKKARSSAKLSLRFKDNGSDVMRIEEMIKSKLDEYISLSQKVQYLNIKLSNSNKLSQLMEAEVPKKSPNVRKIINQQTHKIDILQGKIQSLLEKYKHKKSSLSELIRQKDEGIFRFDYTEDTSSNSSDQKERSFQEILNNFQPVPLTINVMNAIPCISLKKIVKGRDKKGEPKPKVQKVPQKRVQKGKVKLEFKQVLEESEEEDSEGEQLPFTLPQITQQISFMAPKTHAPKKNNTSEIKQSTEKQRQSGSDILSGIKQEDLKSGIDLGEKSKGPQSIFGGIKSEPKVEQSKKDESQKSKTGLFGRPKEVEKPKQQKGQSAAESKLSESKQPAISTLFSKINVPATNSKLGSSLFGGLNSNADTNKQENPPPNASLFFVGVNQQKKEPQPKKQQQIKRQPDKPKAELPKQQPPGRPRSDSPILTDVATALISKSKPPEEQKPHANIPSTSNIFPSSSKPPAPSGLFPSTEQKQNVSQPPKPITQNIFSNFGGKPGVATNATGTTTAPIAGKDNKPSAPFGLPAPNPKPPEGSSNPPTNNIFAQNTASNAGIFGAKKPDNKPVPNVNIFNQQGQQNAPAQPQQANLWPSSSPSTGLGTGVVFGQSSFGNKPMGQPVPAASTAPSNNIFTMGNQGQMKSFGTVSGSSANIFGTNQQASQQPTNNIFNTANTGGWKPESGTGGNSFLGMQMNIQQPTMMNWNQTQQSQQQSGYMQQPQPSFNSQAPTSNSWGQQQNQGQAQNTLFKPRK